MRTFPVRRQDLLILAAFTLLLHLPFLRQAVQGDEVTYLDTAREVLRQPLTPLNFDTVFQGHRVHMAGHPHPPLDAYLLALPWMIAGGFSLVVFHVFYLLLAIAISFAAYALAAYFTSQPLWAALLVAASPLVQVNANTVASPEPPALLFVLIGAAAFFRRRFWISGIALALAGLTALQALALPPILLLAFLLKRERPPRTVWIAMALPYAAMAGWQGLQWALTGHLPGATLAGYVSGPSYSRLGVKRASALALLQHLGVLVTLLPVAPWRLCSVTAGLAVALLVHNYAWWERGLLIVCVALGVNAVLWLWESRRREPVLAGWALLYFAFAAVAFFAGASRYLLPVVAPVVLLFVLQYADRRRWLWGALAFNVLLGLNLSFAAYEFARVYAEAPPPPGRTFLVNGEWGFRYYMLERGGRMLDTGSVPRPGEWIVSSELSLAGNYDSLAEETAVPLRSADLWVRTPLRLIDRHAHSGFSSAAAGVLPFSFAAGPLDRITYARTSPFLDSPGDWMPTQFSGRLVYLPRPGASVRLPVQGRLHFALFGRGRGPARFVIRNAAGPALFDKTVAVDGSLWEEHTLPPAGGEVILSVDAPGTLQAGWGELVADGSAVETAALLPRSYLELGDIRTRPQLLSGWYAIEDGAWRWMAKQAEAVLRVPAERPLNFRMHLYFPPEHMARAGGPVSVSVRLHGRLVAAENYSQAGGCRLEQPVPPDLPAGQEVHVSIRLNRAVPPGSADERELGAVVQGFGFVESK